MFTQTDSRWKNDQMGMKGDTIGRWGCVVTSLANLSLLGKVPVLNGSILTPHELNHVLRAKDGYYGKEFPGMESFIIWDVVRDIFKCVISHYPGAGLPIYYEVNSFYIVRIENSQGGHYVNLIRILPDNYFKIFDVYTGKYQDVKADDIKKVIKISFN